MARLEDHRLVVDVDLDRAASAAVVVLMLVVPGTSFFRDGAHSDSFYRLFGGDRRTCYQNSVPLGTDAAERTLSSITYDNRRRKIQHQGQFLTGLSICRIIHIVQHQNNLGTF
jgi:hypothetical protein